MFRDDASVEVVAFTATQIPGIEGRAYPAVLAGARYPKGIPIVDEKELASLIRDAKIDACVFSYSDVSYSHVMHKAALCNARGADFWLLAADRTMIASKKPVVAITAVRTGSGKSQTTRAALFNDYHAQIVRLAKQHCRTRPLCAGCPLEPACPRVGVDQELSPARTTRPRPEVRA